MFYDPKGKSYDDRRTAQTDSRIDNMLDFWDSEVDNHRSQKTQMQNVMNGSAYNSNNDYYEEALTDDRLYKFDNDNNYELNKMIFDDYNQTGKKHDRESYYMHLNQYDRENIRPEYSLSARGHMDTEHKIYIPSMDHNKTTLDTSQYAPAPYKGQGFGNNDISVESSMIHGAPTKTFKSYGYRNPAEHYFNYIDPAHANRDESVFGFPRGGVSTRLDNKKMRRQYRREIY
jgi:hypothetical protein